MTEDASPGPGLRRISIRDYFKTLTFLVRRPSEFFPRAAAAEGMLPAAVFLAVSSIIYAAAVTFQAEGFSLTVLAAGCLSVFVPPWFQALVGLPILGLLTYSRKALAPLFNVLAYSAGAVALVAWVPSLGLLSEIFRWILVGIGLVRGLRTTRMQAIVFIGLLIGLHLGAAVLLKAVLLG